MVLITYGVGIPGERGGGGGGGGGGAVPHVEYIGVARVPEERVVDDDVEL